MLLLILAASSTAAAAEDGRVTVAQAAFAEGRLWLLDEKGKLATIEPGADRAERMKLPQRGFELCVSNERVFVATARKGERDAWRLRRRERGGWVTEARVPTNGERLVAMACSSAGVSLLTSFRLIEIRGGRQHAVQLSERLSGGRVTTSAEEAGDRLLVGLNAGEWGGGLRSIDRRTGRIEVIERNASGEGCGGPLNTKCDPVHGIAAEPWKPGCVAVAVGLVHFRARGRMVEVCGKQVERIYFKPLGEIGPKEKLTDGEPFSSVPFFGVVRSGGSLWAAGGDGLYRFTGPGAPQFTPMPRFTKVGGYSVSFEIPGLALVLTDINRRASVSGDAPMLVAR